ncbi:hypothetical protein ONZ45_g14034 [Pleurotus djamor]|nr:hypothetical protein ONZ45_g14034 [Pleurotus djamor]
MAPSRTRKQRINEMLDTLTTVLDQVEGPLTLVPIPGLSVAAKSLSMLITMVQKTKSNTVECLQLLERLNGLIDILMSITKAFETATQNETDPSTNFRITTDEQASKDLRDRVDRLLNDVKKILREAQGLSSGNSFQRFFRSKEDEATLRSLNEQVQRAQSQFQLEGTVKIETKMDELITTLQTSQLERDLASIRTVDAGYKAFFNEHKSHWLEGTRTELLKDIDEWSQGIDENATARIFVLTGGAGTGKSTIAFQVAKTLDEAGVLGGSFFFDRGVASSSTGVIFPTLAVQMARYHPELASFIVEGIKKHKAGGHVQQLSYALDQLIVEPLSNVSDEDFPMRPIVFVIDAIDECVEQDQVPNMLFLLLDRLCTLSFPLRLFVTTRPEYHIEDAFVSTRWRDGPKPFRLQDIPMEIVRNDIQRFIETRLLLAGIADTLKAIKDDAIEALTDAAGGHFIYASTCIGFLTLHKRRPVTSLEQVLSGALRHSRLDDLYRVVIVNAFTKDDLEDPVLGPSIPIILGALGALQDQLPPEYLSILLNLEAEILLEVLDRLQSVLTFSWNQPIRLLHASFPQYLMDPKRCTLPNISDHPSFRGNHYLSLHCLQTLLDGDNLKRNICDLPDPLIFTNEIPDLNDRLAQSIPPHVQYASLHWAFHLCNLEPAATGALDPENLLNTFVQTKMLHWMEVLGMIGHIDRAVPMLSHLLDWYKVLHIPPFLFGVKFNFWQVDNSTRALLKEGYRFVMTFRDAIKECPFQIYVSGLGFTPYSSPLRSLYAPQADMLHVLGELEETWGACLRTMEGHGPRSAVFHVSFSHDGQWIASSSSDCTINIWDANGFLLRTLFGHSSSVGPHAFSLDDTIIFSASRDLTIRLWNPVSGAPLKVIECGFNIECLVPSPIVAVTDVHPKLALISESRQTDDYGTCHYICQVTGHDGQTFEQVCESTQFSTMSLDWSIDNGLLAACCGTDIPIFETTTYSVSMSLVGHSEVKAVKFVPRTDLLVSSYDDDTLRLWRLDTSTCIHVFEGYQPWLAVNPRNGLIASTSGIVNLIHFCSISTLDEACAAIDVGPRSIMASMNFSPCGGKLVTGHGWTGLVRLWDVEDRPQGPPPTPRATAQGFLPRFLLSSDGQFMACRHGTSIEDPVMIWSLQDNLPVATVWSHSHRTSIEQIAASTNGIWFVIRWESPVSISLTNLETGDTRHIYMLGRDPIPVWKCASSAHELPPGVYLWDFVVCGVSDDGRCISLQDSKAGEHAFDITTNWLLFDWHSQEIREMEENEVPSEYLGQNSFWQRYAENNAGCAESACVHDDTESVKYYSLSPSGRVTVLDPHPRHAESTPDRWQTFHDSIEHAQTMLLFARSYSSDDDDSPSP